MLQHSRLHVVVWETQTVSRPGSSYSNPEEHVNSQAIIKRAGTKELITWAIKMVADMVMYGNTFLRESSRTGSSVEGACPVAKALWICAWQRRKWHGAS